MRGSLTNRLLVGLAVLSFASGALAGALAGTFAPAYLLQKRPAAGSLPRFELPARAPDDNASSTDAVPPEDAQTVSVVKRALPAVVSINITKELSIRRPAEDFQDFFNDPFFPLNPPRRSEPSQPSAPAPKEKRRIGGGSGFLVSDDGLIVTNKHVVADPEAEYTVVLQDGRKLPAKVLATDPSFDLGFVKVEGAGYPHLNLGDSDKTVIGQTVIAIGYALAEFQNTVTKGVISGMNRRIVAGGDNGDEVIEEALQTDAAINYGNSGGPLIDLSGRVIGMNTAISEEAQSLGFAIPSNIIKRAFEAVKKDGRIARPWLGIRYIQIDEDFAKQNNLSYAYGALILRGERQTDLAVIPGSPADKAGLVENDIVLEINGVKLDEAHSLSNQIGKSAPGDKLKLKIVHQGKEKEIEVTLEERK